MKFHHWSSDQLVTKKKSKKKNVINFFSSSFFQQFVFRLATQYRMAFLYIAICMYVHSKLDRLSEQERSTVHTRKCTFNTDHFATGCTNCM